jgi:hypothetical protein
MGEIGDRKEIDNTSCGVGLTSWRWAALAGGVRIATDVKVDADGKAGR